MAASDFSSVADFALFVATAAISLLLQFSSYEPKKGDLLESFLHETAPVSAAQELKSLPQGCHTCERRLNDIPLILTKDPRVAHYVFKGCNSRNYVQRPACDNGLKKLGMFCSGLIWNNDTPLWQKIRGCFQKALNDVNLKRAVFVIRSEVTSLVDSESEKRHGSDGVNLLEISRRLTFRATLNVFFGIDSMNFSKMNIAEDAFIAAIVAFFKAWEYFLLRPESHWDGVLSENHSKAVSNLQDHVRNMLLSIENCEQKSEANKTQPKLFVESLREVCHQESLVPDLLCQSALEMLLAGTDTSSVTAYYTLLALAGDKTLQQDLRKELDAAADSSPLLKSIVDETLRFKPVGPVVLRQAVQDDPDFPHVSIKAGTAVLIHLAEMNLDKAFWSNNPQRFMARRFLDSCSYEETFFPFGNGPKGCIGMYLGRREVNAIVVNLIQNYDMEIVGHETLETLETHWDIANQPDEPIKIRLSKRISN